MIKVRVTMDLPCPGMNAETAKAHALAAAKGAGFVDTKPLAVLDQPRARNWWREMVHQTWSDADYAWQAERERATFMYETEMAEWEELNPRPLYKDFMTGMKGAAS